MFFQNGGRRKSGQKRIVYTRLLCASWSLGLMASASSQAARASSSALIAQGVSQINVGPRVVRIDKQRLSKTFFCLVKLAFFKIGVAHVDM